MKEEIPDVNSSPNSGNVIFGCECINETSQINKPIPELSKSICATGTLSFTMLQ
jgi:hypothetical protein